MHAKIVSDRIGHAHEGITVAIYGHRSTGHDRAAADLVAAGLIRCRLDDAPEAGCLIRWSHIWSQHMRNGPRDDLPRAVFGW